MTNTLLHTIQSSYSYINPYIEKIIAAEYARQGGEYNDATMRWSDDVAMTYMHTKRASYSLTESDWTWVVRREKEIEFTHLQDSELDILMRLVPEHRIAWFHYIGTLHPDYKTVTLTSVKALECRLLNLTSGSCLRGHDVREFLSLDATEAGTMLANALDKYMDYVIMRLDHETGVTFLKETEEVIKRLFSYPHYLDFFMKTGGKKAWPLKMARLCPKELKLVRHDWGEPLREETDIFIRFPKYLKKCINKTGINVYRECYMNALVRLCESAPEKYVTEWMQGYQKAVLEPWLWLPLDVLPEEYCHLRRQHGIDLSNKVDSASSSIKRLIKIYENIHLLHTLGDEQWSQYSRYHPKDIPAFLKNINIYLGSKTSLSNYDINILNNECKMPVPTTWQKELRKQPVVSPDHEVAIHLS